MRRYPTYSGFLLLILFILFSSPVSGQVKGKGNELNYQPVIGQSGKDVVWVPTPDILVEKMLDMAKITPDDLLYDLGSGDGRTVITAAKRGTRSIGLEYNPDLVELSKIHAKTEGVSKMADFVVADIFEYDFTDATVVTMFLLSDINLRLRPKLLEMKPGTRIVSNTFTMAEWIADDSVYVENEVSWNRALMWIVPAKVEGKWSLQNGGEILFLQRFQKVTGELRIAGQDPINIAGKLTGDEIEFTAGMTTYTGKVDGNTLKGSATSGSHSAKWSASR
jgi:SAM-dependent methyltransferase